MDINPLAVELARVSLWVETLDPDLPFSFLDHKIKVGNSLVGCWLDRVEDYPLKAWEREGGDGKNGERTGRIETLLKGERGGNRRSGDGIITREMKDLIEGGVRHQPPLFPDMHVTTDKVVAEARIHYEALHDLPAHTTPDERERLYRETVVGSPTVQQLRRAMNERCSVWFWPTDEESLQCVPTPLTFHRHEPEKDAIIEKIAAELKFFHWELEFPDVFSFDQWGFDATVGNPPWGQVENKTLEYFSDFDPLFRTYRDTKAKAIIVQLFESDAHIELGWKSRCSQFASFTNWIRSAEDPYDMPFADSSVRSKWKQLREEHNRKFNTTRLFSLQGTGKLDSYKLFIELFLTLASGSGHCGVIVPSGLYSDKGTTFLRKHVLDKLTWDWLYGFWNKQYIFKIDYHLKFCVAIMRKESRSVPTRTAFLIQDVEAWESLTGGTLAYDKQLVSELSPRQFTFVEVRGERELDVLRQVYDVSVPVSERHPSFGTTSYTQGDFNMKSGLFKPLDLWESEGYTNDAFGIWRHARKATYPFYIGKNIEHHDFAANSWLSGKGRSATWVQVPCDSKIARPAYLMPEDNWSPDWTRLRLFVREGCNVLNARSFVFALAPDFPCGHLIVILDNTQCSLVATLVMQSVCGSLAFDWTFRRRLSGRHVSEFIVNELPCPRQIGATATRSPCASLCSAWANPSSIRCPLAQDPTPQSSADNKGMEVLLGRH